MQSQAECERLHSGEYPVRTNLTGVEQSRTLTVSIVRDPRIHSDSKLKITLSDKMDPSFLCVLAIAPQDYDSIKKSQGLLVDFHDFPTRFVQLLQQCDCGKLYLYLSRHSPSDIFLEIIEKNDFKRLVHLSLKTAPASDADIKKNMADVILSLQKNLHIVTSTLNSKESMFKDREKLLQSRIDDLNDSYAKASSERMQRESEIQDMLRRERERLEQEKHEWKKCTELHSRNEIEALHENLNKKEKMLQESSIRCQQLEDTVKSLDIQIIDKTQRVLMLEKQLYTAKSDTEVLRNQNGVLDRECHDKDMSLQQTKTKLADTEKTLQEKSNILRDALDSLSSLKREKMVLEDRANHHEVLSTKRNLELQSVNEDLVKANQIIKKQNDDILEYREKLMCRTAIAIEQEKVIEKNNKEMTRYEQNENKLLLKINEYEKDAEQLQMDLESCKRMLEEKGEIIKNNNAVIQWLHKKLDALQSDDDPIPPPSHRQTTLRSISQTEDRDNNKLSDLYLVESSDSIISDSKYGKSEQSVKSNELPQTQYSLDSIYLKPPPRSSSQRSKSQDSQSRITSSAPENKNSKKSNKTNTRSSRSSTTSRKSKNEDRYISSAISSYFPK